MLVQLLSRPGGHELRSVIEPCAGTGAIAKVLKSVGLHVWCNEIDPARATRCRDIARRGEDYDWITVEHDFLSYDVLGGWDLCLTNPPFSLALAFVEKSLRIAKCTVMLLPLNFMSSIGRVEFNTKHPAHVHVLPRRPSFGLNKHGKPGTDAQDYGWFQWGGPGYVPSKWEPLPI